MVYCVQSLFSMMNFPGFASLGYVLEQLSLYFPFLIPPKPHSIASPPLSPFAQKVSFLYFLKEVPAKSPQLQLSFSILLTQ